MKNLYLIIFISLLNIANADEYKIDLLQSAPQCNQYTITQVSTRKEALNNCEVIDTHNGWVRIFHGTETIDIHTTNMGNISCKFARSLINSDGTLKECYSTTPPANESANVTIQEKESTLSIESNHS